ncbi:TetR/AcrR family transcriptional regulator [Terriglobus albidus]|uniref:TetR/AcrR family transcriptional regulator n=1 Tax=Terriglobus albidus TaxID=1592106 RepID=UPI0021DFC8A0|nr:TetR/AcrR family transcriptional regulator [Terriglobus albidus]
MSTSKTKPSATLDRVSSAKQRILQAVLTLLARRGNAEVSMAEIARAAGISRQALYLHFPERSALFIALAAFADEHRGLASELDRVHNAPSGLAALEAFVTLQARMNPGIWAVARSVDAVRRRDQAAEAAWQNRLRNRLATCRRIIKKLNQDGALRTGLNSDIAVDLLWTITSLRTWEDLVLERKWPAEVYRTHVMDILSRSLLK